MIEEFMNRLRVYVKDLEVAIADGDQAGFLEGLRELKEDVENVEEACDATR